MSTPAPVLEIVGLRKSYKGHLSIGRREVVKGLDLSIQPGEVFGLLGQNGAGKTTTLKMILALIFPDAGRIRIFGEDYRSIAHRHRVGFLPENPWFYEYLTGREFLDFYGQLFGYARAERATRAEAVLAKVGMTDRADLPLRKYSKGMLQRIGMAQALINDPELVILDEPMSGLDPIGRREFRDIILDLKRRGRTIFFSSHILSDAEAICDRVGILKDGRIGVSGRLADLLSPTVRSWEVLYAGPPFARLAGADAGQESDPGRAACELLSERGAESLVAVHQEAALSRLLDAIRTGGGSLISVSARRETLEDLYVREVSGR